MNTDRRTGLAVFECFPAIKSLGQQRLQTLCDDWIKTPQAKEFAVTALEVNEQNSKLLLNFTVTIGHSFEKGEAFHFPMDDLLGFIADNGFDSPELRMNAKASIREARRRGGHDVFQKFIITNVGQPQPLFLECKNPTCKRPLKTQYSKHEKSRVLPWKGTATCPKCGQTNDYNENDLQLRPDLTAVKSLAIGDSIEIDGGLTAKVLALHANGRAKTIRIDAVRPIQPGMRLNSLKCVVLGANINFVSQTTELELSDR